jgi:hypothetical protein
MAAAGLMRREDYSDKCMASWFSAFASRALFYELQQLAICRIVQQYLRPGGWIVP